MFFFLKEVLKDHSLYSNLQNKHCKDEIQELHNIFYFSLENSCQCSGQWNSRYGKNTDLI